MMKMKPWTNKWFIVETMIGEATDDSSRRRIDTRGGAAVIARREFLKRATFAGMGALYGMAGQAGGVNKMAENDRDRFGGWRARKFEATGFFRTEHDGERWWLVTPEGNAFLSFGINHYHAGWWAQDYNRDHWTGTFGAQRPWDEAWRNGFRKAAMADLERLGLNTLGIHTDAPMLTDPPAGPVMPYVRRYEPIVLSHYLKPTPETYVDIFAPAFETQCDTVAREMAAPYAADPMLLGYCMADCPIMTDGDAQWSGGTTWPRVLRNLGAGAPGKQAYVAAMRERYTNVEAFNANYAATSSQHGTNSPPPKTGDPPPLPSTRRSATTTTPSSSSASTATTPSPRLPSTAPIRTTSSSATRSTPTATPSTASWRSRAATPTWSTTSSTRDGPSRRPCSTGGRHK